MIKTQATIQDALNMRPGAYYLGHREKSLELGIREKFADVCARYGTSGRTILPALGFEVRRQFDRYRLANCVKSLVALWPYIPDDTRRDGEVDHWETPFEFLFRGGDCEGFAITDYFLFREFGVRPEDLRLVLGRTPEGSGHAVCALKLDGIGWCFLDNRIVEVPIGELDGFQPVASVNEDRSWILVAEPERAAPERRQGS